MRLIRELIWFRMTSLNCKVSGAKRYIPEKYTGTTNDLLKLGNFTIPRQQAHGTTYSLFWKLQLKVQLYGYNEGMDKIWQLSWT